MYIKVRWSLLFMCSFIVYLWLAGMSPAASAQVNTITYRLDNVQLLPDISHPWEPAQQMTGTFEWTYEEGDFENGSGQFIDVSTPWYNPGLENLNINIDLTSIEFTLIGNWHDLGIDITLFLLEPLSLDQTVAIDTVRSQFEIQQGVSHQGHVVSGSIVHATSVSVTNVSTSDLSGTPKNKFFPGDPIRYNVNFAFTGDLLKKYKVIVVGKVKAPTGTYWETMLSGQVLNDYPGSYATYWDETIPTTATPGSRAKVIIGAILKDGAVKLDQDVGRANIRIQ